MQRNYPLIEYKYQKNNLIFLRFFLIDNLSIIQHILFKVQIEIAAQKKEAKILIASKNKKYLKLISHKYLIKKTHLFVLGLIKN